MRISDWSSDVCSSDLAADRRGADVAGMGKAGHLARHGAQAETGVGRIIGGLEPPVVEAEADRKSVVEGKSVSVRVDLGGRRIIKKQTTTYTSRTHRSACKL